MEIPPKKNKKTDIKLIRELADKLETWFETPENIWLGEFASQNNVHRQYFPIWAEKHNFFKIAYERAKQKQEAKLFKKGMEAKNPAFVIFALKNVANWRDKKEETVINENNKIEDTLPTGEALDTEINKLRKLNEPD